MADIAGDNPPGASARGSNPNEAPQASASASRGKQSALTPDQEQKERNIVAQFYKESPGSGARFQGELTTLLHQGVAAGATPGNVNDLLGRAAAFPQMLEIAKNAKGGQLSGADHAKLGELTDRIVDNLSNLGPFEIPVAKAVEKFAQYSDIHSEAIDEHLIRRVVEIVNRHPQSSESRELLGRVHARLGQPEAAVEDYSEALRLDPGNAEARQGRFEALYQLGDYADAHQDAHALLQADPGNPLAIAMLELTAGRDGPSEGYVPGASVVGPQGTPQASPETGAARIPSYLDAAASISPAQRQSAHYTRQAASLLALQDSAEAARQATLALSLDSQNAQAYNYRAMALVRSGQYESALEDANEALHLVPKDPTATVTKAYILNGMERYGEAESLLEDSGFGPGSDSAYALYNLAFADAGLGRRQAMLNALAKAARLDAGQFSRLYQMALQAPESSDLRYLFMGGSAPNALAGVSEGASKKGGNWKFLLVLIVASIGGLLMALDLLYTLAPEWTRATARRLMAQGIRGPAESVISGSYRILRKVGSGGMGTVYEALDMNLQRPVALKKMRAEIREDPQERRRFLKEARTVAALHHPNIVEIYAIVEDASELCLIFEYVEGQTLRQVLGDKGPLGFDPARKILKEVCMALAYAHANRVIHRDLKPSNIMIARSGAVKVMDFGIAREVKDAVSRLMTNTIAGTPPYMAPEVEQGKVGKEADVYSLGVCLYELLTGAVPFAGAGTGMLVNKMTMDFRPLSSLVPGLPSGIDELLAWALYPAPEMRIKTPVEFFDALSCLPIG